MSHLLHGIKSLLGRLDWHVLLYIIFSNACAHSVTSLFQTVIITLIDIRQIIIKQAFPFKVINRITLIKITNNLIQLTSTKPQNMNFGQPTRSTRKKQEQTLLCSVHSLTNFCLSQCIQVGQYSKLISGQSQRCVGECASFVIDKRLNLKDKWAKEMNETQSKNEKIWNSYLEDYIK